MGGVLSRAIKSCTGGTSAAAQDDDEPYLHADNAHQSLEDEARALAAANDDAAVEKKMVADLYDTESAHLKDPIRKTSPSGLPHEHADRKADSPIAASRRNSSRDRKAADSPPSTSRRHSSRDRKADSPSSSSNSSPATLSASALKSPSKRTKKSLTPSGSAMPNHNFAPVLVEPDVASDAFLRRTPRHSIEDNPRASRRPANNEFHFTAAPAAPPLIKDAESDSPNMFHRNGESSATSSKSRRNRRVEGRSGDDAVGERSMRQSTSGEEGIAKAMPKPSNAEDLSLHIRLQSNPVHLCSAFCREKCALVNSTSIPNAQVFHEEAGPDSLSVSSVDSACAHSRRNPHHCCTACCREPSAPVDMAEAPVQESHPESAHAEDEDLSLYSKLQSNPLHICSAFCRDKCAQVSAAPTPSAQVYHNETVSSAPLASSTSSTCVRSQRNPLHCCTACCREQVPAGAPDGSVQEGYSGSEPVDEEDLSLYVRLQSNPLHLCSAYCREKCAQVNAAPIPNAQVYHEESEPQAPEGSFLTSACVHSQRNSLHCCSAYCRESVPVPDASVPRGHPRTWTSTEVTQWLDSQGLLYWAREFAALRRARNADVDGAALVALDDAKLAADFPESKSFVRKHFLRRVEALCLVRESYASNRDTRRRTPTPSDADATRPSPPPAGDISYARKNGAAYSRTPLKDGAGHTRTPLKEGVTHSRTPLKVSGGLMPASSPKVRVGA